MPGFREFLRSRSGQYVGMGIVVLGVAAAAYSIYSNVGSDPALDMANTRVLIDAKTGQVFRVQMKPGMTVPAKAPSGGETGYDAEVCYWTKDGKIKTDPTYVLLNTHKGLPEPTFCPDCGRLVRSHNPPPVGTSPKPPPTKDEYESRNNH